MRSVPPTLPIDGMTLCAPPEWTEPQTSAAPARGSSRRESTAGTSVTTLASAYVRSWVRCGRDGVAAAARERDLDLVGGGGDGADAQADLAGVEAGVAVQREDAVDPDEAVLGHDVLGAAGHELLGGLEDEAGADARGDEPVLDRLERERRADERGRVHVVPAGVADAVGLRREVEAGLLADRQGVDVGAQRDAVRGLGRAEVGDEPGAAQPRGRRCRPRSSRSATSAVVRTSPRPSSGWVCRSRRIATSSAACCSTVRAMASKGSESGAVGHEHGSLARGWARPRRRPGSPSASRRQDERSRVESEARSATRSGPTPSGTSSGSSTARCPSRP